MFQRVFEDNGESIYAPRKEELSRQKTTYHHQPVQDIWKHIMVPLRSFRAMQDKFSHQNIVTPPFS